ncbi:uncharacterized protein ARMOST_11426 [Armillaria ostoyae]|uniref:Ricin B lectin domain-containing protein n=1 Tax=Armillaria ostoyae TaxID=47428 RepID=A0A284RH58_ARMOS|nr:uncharacterized protein ARMOST_11426 [Armillaria ostoyae]
MDLKPGVYNVRLARPNAINNHTHINLAGFDRRSIICWPGHDGKDQKWKFAKLDVGYSIQSVYDDSYLSIDFEDSGLHQIQPRPVASSFPVIWDVKLADNGEYKIRWPNSSYIFSRGSKLVDGSPVVLSKQCADESSQLWYIYDRQTETPAQPEMDTVVAWNVCDSSDVVTTTMTTTTTGTTTTTTTTTRKVARGVN